MNAASTIIHRVRPMLLAAALGAGCVIFGATAAETKEAPKDAKADAKAAPAASTNTASPWKIELPKSAFTADVRDRQKYKGYTDPFFPKTERIFPKPKVPTNAPPVVATGTNTTGAGTVTAPIPPKPEPPPPPKWYANLKANGVVGTIVIIQAGSEGYNFRQGQTREMITTKGPGKVTCVKITKTTVELKMAGEDETAVLELP
jgi:hypothetical protein